MFYFLLLENDVKFSVLNFCGSVKLASNKDNIALIFSFVFCFLGF